MKVVFYTEMNFRGKVKREHENMRTEFAWMVALNADHMPLSSLLFGPKDAEVHNDYDLGIIIFPKNIPGFLLEMSVVKTLKRQCKKVAFMQEGPSWYFQDLPIKESFWFLSEMQACDFCLAHNQVDATYYEGLLSIPCYINPTLIIEDSVKGLPQQSTRQGVIIGGNLVRWYGGLNSLMVVKSIVKEDEPIYLPKMGRMLPEEEHIQGLNHLPYSTWTKWMYNLDKFKYAIHLNPNTIGGTFSLNCAYLGIPCIGNIKTATQQACFPELSVFPDDIKTAKSLFYRLYHDQDFYNECSVKARVNYQAYFTEEAYKRHWDNEIFKLEFQNN